jgi:hypothetical protein
MKTTLLSAIAALTLIAAAAHAEGEGNGDPFPFRAPGAITATGRAGTGAFAAGPRTPPVFAQRGVQTAEAPASRATLRR